jgi:hypothetical protein
MLAAVTESGRSLQAAVTETGRPLQAAVAGSGRYRRPLQEAGGGDGGGRYISNALRQYASTPFWFLAAA